MLFREKNNSIEHIKEREFVLEKDIQGIVESNLESLFDLNFVDSEFAVADYRIDTLAYDSENNCFIIIEYKRGRNDSLVDQGYSYLATLFERRADFVLKYNEVFKESRNLKDFEWGQSRVIFISQTFTDYQVSASNFKNNPIELYKIKRYDGNIIEIEAIKKAIGSNSKKSPVKKIGGINKVDKVIKVYTEEDHFNNISDKIKELYEEFKDRITAWGDIEIKPTQLYIAFKSRSNFADFIFNKNKIKIILNLRKGELKSDYTNIARDMSETGSWGNGDYQLEVVDDSNIEYVLSLIKQSWEKNKF